VAKQGTRIKELEWTIKNLRKKEPATNSLNEPVRQILASKIIEANPKTVLEVGCGYGQNLHILSQKIPDAKLLGFDMNRTAINYAKKIMQKATLWTGYIEETLQQSADKTIDVTFTNAALMYIAPQDIREVMKNIIRITKKKIVLVELLPTRWEDDPLGMGTYEKGKWSRNYMAHLKGYPIRITQIPKDSHLDERWKKQGAIVEAIL